MRRIEKDIAGDLRETATLGDLGAFLATYPGGVSVEEGTALSEYAKQCPNGVIVEIGSYKGKSSVALAYGQARGRFAENGLVYSIEPHLPFTGLYGRDFGPQDRRDFYAVMLETGFFERVCLVNLKSDIAATGWRQAIGLLFIDGDHTLAGTRSDVAAWERHVVVGGIVVFDDAADPAAGPHHVIQTLLRGGRFAWQGAVGKMVALRKLVSLPSVAESNGKRILVACHELSYSGGLLRFERFGRVIEQFGYHLAFTAFAEVPRQARDTKFPLLTFEEAARTAWDITIVPGAGFPESTIARFAEFHAQRFGLRVQHVLNDVSKRDGFLSVNAAFRPNIVLFNNRHWRPGDFTDFQAEAFYFLEGAVDVEHFAPDPARHYRSPSKSYVVGGLANKNAEPLIEAVRRCGEGVELHLFGQTGDIAATHRRLIDEGKLRLFGMLDEAALPGFYADLDCVVHTERFAGWANLAAEAMASGVPVICTSHGTGAFAEHETTALVVPGPDPDTIAQAIQRLRKDRSLAGQLAHNARQRIQGFSWTSYSATLLRLMQRPNAFYYTWAPELGLFGKWPEAARLAGMEPLLAECRGKSVCDLGAGDGVIARRFLDRGAALVHGFELEQSRVELAARLCGGFAEARFWQADLSNWPAFETAHRAHLRERYDIVLYLGLHHHLPPANRMNSLAEAAARASDLLAVRTPATLYAADNIQAFLESRGFMLIDAQSDDNAKTLGGSHLFRRRAQP
jgi:2-polyprenyl-3-methyl-5-hydroxy-6-metoxy-1,4-benzoquinol methylase/predicted O-methyltransferase YrrM